MASLSADATTSHRPEGTLFLQAEHLAESHVKQWIRSVLREVALQSLRANLVLVDSVAQLEDGAIGNAQDLCRAVANKWCEKLRESGHVQVCEWIEHVVEEETEVLFYVPRSEQNTSEQAATATSDQDQRQSAQESTTDSSPCVTAVARLQKIGRRDLLQAEVEPVSIEAAIQQIDQLATQKQVDWPYSWKLIQDKCDEIPARLHNSKKEKAEIVLVPKSVLDHQQTDNDVETQAFILKRKRKSRHKILQSFKQPRVDEEEAEPAFDPDALYPPRSPSKDGAHQWYQEDLALTEQEQRYLDETFLHQTVNTSADTSSPAVVTPPSTVLGSLRDTGHFHHSLQQAVDRPTTDQSGSSTNKMLTVRQRRWHRRGSINERLGGHKLVQDPREAGHVSRILRTVDRRGQHWFDLDLGHCLVEFPEPGSQRRKLYYFDSLEATLLDEDDNEGE